MLKVSYDLEDWSQYEIEISSWTFQTKIRFLIAWFPLTQILGNICKWGNSALVESYVQSLTRFLPSIVFFKKQNGGDLGNRRNCGLKQTWLFEDMN